MAQTQKTGSKRFVEAVVAPLIFLVTGLAVLWLFDVSRGFECRRADNLCTLEVTRFLGLKHTRTGIPPAEIRNVFSRKHALEQGWTYRLYIATEDGLSIGTEIGTDDSEAVVEANRAKLARFLADPAAPDIAMKDAPKRLNRYAGLGVLAFAGVLFAAARRKGAG